MTRAITRRIGRPLWMTPYGMEGIGDIFFDRLWPEWKKDYGKEWTPRFDFIEKEGKYTLKAELPGLKKDDITISLEDGYVTVKGKKEYNKEEEGTDYHLKETRYGSFSRSFRLPEKVAENNIDANYKDGVLTVVMTKKEEEEKKKIIIH